MQDIAYKIWKKLADNKEIIVLLVMLLVFAYYLFLMFQKVEPEDNSRIAGPGQGGPTVPPPSTGPMIDISEDYTALVRQNFFWVKSQISGDSNAIDKRSIGIKVLDFQETAGINRVQLRTTSTTKWYVEGDTFEDFELLEINPEIKTVVVYATQFTRQVTISLEQ